MAEHESPAEETIALTRRARRRAAGAEPSVPAEDGATVGAPNADAEERTIAIVRRSRKTEQAAAVSEEPSAAPDASVAEDDERTIVVARGGDRRPAGPTDSVDAAAPAAIVAAPVAAPTPTPSIYKPRPAPLTPAAPPIVEGAPEPTRVEDPDLPSVVRQSRRWSIYAVAGFATACVASVAGLAVLVFVLILG